MPISQMRTVRLPEVLGSRWVHSQGQIGLFSLSGLLEPSWAHSSLKLLGRARTKCVRNWAQGILEWDWEFWGQGREEYKLYHSDLEMGVCRPQGGCLALA